MINTNIRSGKSLTALLRGITVRRGFAWGLIIIGALFAFEIFNYSTTQYALADVLGELKFAGIRWATILAIAFCGIDFAGIARLFTPEQGRDEPTEIWYLFGAWLLGAGFNAVLTWWGVAVAISNHASQSAGTVMSATTITKVVPVFVALMVWLIRVLIIGTFSVAGERLFSQADVRSSSRPRPALQPSAALNPRPRMTTATNSYRPAAKPGRNENGYHRQEPTYHNVPLQAKSAREIEYTDPPRNA
jgi:hypothetical protein